MSCEDKTSKNGEFEEVYFLTTMELYLKLFHRNVFMSD